MQEDEAMPDPGFDELAEDECRTPLAEHHLDRLAVGDVGRPMSFPVTDPGDLPFTRWG